MENTSVTKNLDWVIQDHLHTRGEYFKITNLTVPGPGSPPHTWRILSLISLKAAKNGITSTHVENTQSLHNFRRLTEDHLHTRGEYNLSG